MIPAPMGGATTQNNWQHAMGQVCFTRTVELVPTLPVKSAP
jgi:hypothetical protein